MPSGRESGDVTSCLTGGGIYEQAVLDTAWPRKPSIVRPAEGGANRKLFWVPANICALVILVLAVLASWPLELARNATLVAAGLFAVINLVTVAYFGREVTALGPPYHNLPNGSVSEIKSMPRLSLRSRI